MLAELLEQAIVSTDPDFGLSKDHLESLRYISEQACNGNQKAVLTVLVTLLTKKVASPRQDIRLHQANMPGGFSGRGLDTHEITPFLRSEHFPHMRESGWLTRSLEQAVPYDQNYTGRITPKRLKSDFLFIVSDIQNGLDAKACLLFLLRKLADWRSLNASLKLSKPTGKRIIDIVKYVEDHWRSDIPGVSKLPTLATYAAYVCLVSEVAKYRDCTLLPLLSHTSADTRTERLGDVEVRDVNNNPFEAVEVKHMISISLPMLGKLREKIAGAGIKTFYILSTDEVIPPDDMPEITNLLLSIRNSYGCQVIINGVASTLRYYLRLLSDADRFIHEYVDSIEKDKEIPFDLKRTWNEIVG